MKKQHHRVGVMPKLRQEQHAVRGELRNATANMTVSSKRGQFHITFKIAILYDISISLRLKLEFSHQVLEYFFAWQQHFLSL